MDNSKSYYCPMHPEVTSDVAGDCSICGMALVSSSAEDDLRHDPWVMRFWVSLLFTIIVIGLDLAHASRWLEALFAAPVVFWGGFPFYKRALLSKKANMFTLIAMGTFVSYVYSLFGEHLYFETASVITTLVLLGQYIEGHAHKKTRAAITKLLHLAPSTAWLLMPDGSLKEVPVEEIVKGSKIRVRKGDKIAIDGHVVEGAALVDESMLTGEPLPVTKTKGDTVFAGTINQGESFVVEADAVGVETQLSRIVKMVSDAEKSHPPIQNLVDTICNYFVPGVLILALITFFIWMFFTSVATAVQVAVSVLIIACPCALGLATPLSIVVAIGRLATSGVLVRQSEALQAMAAVDTLVVDKTGTLTLGKPKVVRVIAQDTKKTIQLAASIEATSAHPFASAILAKAKALSLPLLPVTDVKTCPGLGITAKIEGSFVLIGNRQLLVDNHVDVVSVEETHTVIYVAQDGKFLGQIVIDDPIRETSKEAISELHQEGLYIVCLTGDRKAPAEEVAKALDIDRVVAELLPEEKYQAVIRLQQEGKIVAFAGDGINDAPALMQADCSIAMGTGVDIAIESAQVTLIQPDLKGVVRLVRLSRRAVINIEQNLLFAFLYNVLALPVAAGVLYPFFGILLHPMLASFLMVLSSLSVVFNSLRLYRANI